MLSEHVQYTRGRVRVAVCTQTLAEHSGSDSASRTNFLRSRSHTHTRASNIYILQIGAHVVRTVVDAEWARGRSVDGVQRWAMHAPLPPTHPAQKAARTHAHTKTTIGRALAHVPRAGSDCCHSRSNIGLNRCCFYWCTTHMDRRSNENKTLTHTHNTTQTK